MTVVDEYGEPVMLVAERVEYLPRRIVDFMKREAKRDLEHTALRHAMMLSVRVKAIRLRDQTSRWAPARRPGISRSRGG